MADLRAEPSEGAGATVRMAASLIIVSFVFGVLYLGRTVLEPLAIAVLLAFVLTPPIRRLRRLHVGRAASVIAVVALALGLIVGLGFVMETQVARLAGEIPKYQANLQGKIVSFNKALVSSGTLKQASSTLDSLAAELGGGKSNQRTEGNQSPAPVPVEVQTPQPATLQYVQELVNPLIEPLTMGGLLVLFLVFMLFYREDLRDRILRLGGTRDLQATTAAMNDAGTRLSRYFLIQATINASFGVVIAVALWVIGVPNAILWGMLAAILRFVPYVGTPIAAVFPLALAAAIDPGWTRVLLTAALFLSAEVTTGQLIEPVLQGQQTGLSPVAVVLAQLFWTLIWGVPGLLLAVPITVCIAVLGRHVEALNFLGIVLSDEPALAPHEGFYQRVLAGDATEAAYQAERQLIEQDLSSYYDAVPMKALALAHADAARGKLSEERQAELLEVIEEVVEDLEDHAGEDVEKQPAAAGSIVLIAARSAIDQAANLLLADVLEKQGVNAQVQPYSRGGRATLAAIPRSSPNIVCISSFAASEAGAAPVRYLIRRWRKTAPEARFFACFWRLADDAAKLQDLRKAVSADFAAATVQEAAGECREQLALALDHKPEFALEESRAASLGHDTNRQSVRHASGATVD